MSTVQAEMLQTVYGEGIMKSTQFEKRQVSLEPGGSFALLTKSEIQINERILLHRSGVRSHCMTQGRSHAGTYIIRIHLFPNQNPFSQHHHLSRLNGRDEVLSASNFFFRYMGGDIASAF